MVVSLSGSRVSIGLLFTAISVIDFFVKKLTYPYLVLSLEPMFLFLITK